MSDHKDKHRTERRRYRRVVQQRLSDALKAMRESEEKCTWVTLQSRRLKIVPPPAPLSLLPSNSDVLLVHKGKIKRAVVTDKDGWNISITYSGQEESGSFKGSLHNMIRAVIVEDHPRKPYEGEAAI